MKRTHFAYLALPFLLAACLPQLERSGATESATGQKNVTGAGAQMMSRNDAGDPATNPAAATAMDSGVLPGWDGGKSWQKPTEALLKEKLNEMQFKVTQEEGTEPAFRNEYWDNQAAGIYVDIVSGEPLFSSTDKFKSGTGWPSFTRPIPGVKIVEKTDHHLGYPRTEVRSKMADSHLGHVFNDGPAPTGLRYCVNSAALRFIPKEKLKEQGYGEFLSLFEPAAKKAASP